MMGSMRGQSTTSEMSHNSSELGNESGTLSRSHSIPSEEESKLYTFDPMLKTTATDCCTLCEGGIRCLRCLICGQRTHKKCAQAFLRGTMENIDLDLDTWKCPRCLTLERLRVMEEETKKFLKEGSEAAKDTEKKKKKGWIF